MRTTVHKRALPLAVVSSRRLWLDLAWFDGVCSSYPRLKELQLTCTAEPAFLVLGLTQTCFEGSMYLFVFLWVPSLQEAGGPELPLGYIFSSFMISMMLGSIIYTTISSTAASMGQSSLPTDGRTNGGLTNRSSSDSSLVLHAKLASLICAFAALSLAYTASFQPSSAGVDVVSRKFWAFCAFEACVGAYYPVMGMLRGALVPNEVRATVRFLSPMKILRSVPFTQAIPHSCPLSSASP